MESNAVTVTTRTEFGFARTVCGCRSCQINCEHMPGFLVPADMPRIAQKLGFAPQEDLGEFGVRYLRASPGWGIGVQDKLTGRIVRTIRLPTLVPARQENGHCVFLKDGRCEIHDVSPYGCAFFDNHMPDAEADKRMQAALLLVAQDHDDSGDYKLLGDFLRNKGLTARGPEIGRLSLMAARRAEGLDP